MLQQRTQTEDLVRRGPAARPLDACNVASCDGPRLPNAAFLHHRSCHRLSAPPVSVPQRLIESEFQSHFDRHSQGRGAAAHGREIFRHHGESAEEVNRVFNPATHRLTRRSASSTPIFDEAAAYASGEPMPTTVSNTRGDLVASPAIRS
jgi:hypothetical protein